MLNKQLPLKRTFRNFERLERIYGVLSCMSQCVPDVPSNDLPLPMNSEQQTTHRIVTRITQEAVRFYTEMTEKEGMSTRVEMMSTKAMILIDSSGSGKTYVMNSSS